MKLQESLRLVRGAVAVKDLIPVLTHFHIYDGRIQGGNGRIAIDVPAPEELKDFNITVPAERFLKAVDACDGEPKLSLTEAGKLRVSKGSFRALLPLAKHNEFPIMKCGDLKPWKEVPLLNAFRALRPFVSEDASRPWSCGILVDGHHCYATNNIILARTKVMLTEPFHFNMPVFAVDELLRIGREPQGTIQDENSVTVDLGDGIWFKSLLYTTEWPNVSSMFIETDIEVPDKLLEAVIKILPFCPDPKYPKIRFSEDGISTEDGEMSASIEGLSLHESSFRAEPLLAMLRVATHFDPTPYPDPCPFSGPEVEGIIVGVRE